MLKFYRAFDIIKKTVGENSIDAGMIYQNLGVLEGQRPNPDHKKIHELNLKNLAIVERCLEDNPKDMRLTFCLENIANNLYQAQDFTGLEEYMWRAGNLLPLLANVN